MTHCYEGLSCYNPNSMAEALKVILFLGTVRENRMCSRVANFMKKQLEANNFQVDVFDPMVMNFPMLKMPVHWYPNKSDAPPEQLQYEKRVYDADAFVVLTAEYNSAPPPALLNMLDHLPPNAFTYKPSGIVSYSVSRIGGARAVTPLRLVLSELGSVSMPTVFGIPQVDSAMTEEGSLLENHKHLTTLSQKMIDELRWYGSALKDRKETYGIPGEEKKTKKAAVNGSL